MARVIRHSRIRSLRNDQCPVPGRGRQDAVVSDQVESWRRHKRRELLNQLQRFEQKVFVVEVVVGDEVVARSSGRTKKEAQQEAARKALEGLKDTGPGNENQATSEGDSS